MNGLNVRFWKRIGGMGMACVAMAAMGTTAIAAEDAGPSTALTIYSSAQPGAIPPELYKPDEFGNQNRGDLPGYAFVKQERQIDLKQGRSSVRFTDVASEIDPTTVAFVSLADPATRVLEQNYQFDLVSAAKLMERYIDQNITVITDRTHLVHVSGHPRRDELAELIGWIRPQVLVPVHGEPLHLSEHAALARSLGVPRVIECRNGDLVRLAPDPAEIVDEVPHGRLYKDGSLIVESESRSFSERRRLSFSGFVTVALAINEKGALMADPEIELLGIPEKGARGEVIAEAVAEAVLATVETLPRPRRRDPDTVAEAVRRAVRAAITSHWGKKPLCHVHVLTV